MNRAVLRSFAFRLMRVVLALVLGAVVLFYAINLYGFPKPLNQRPTLWIALGTLALMLAAALPSHPPAPARRRWPVVLLTALAVLCTVPFAFSRKEFGNGDVSAILFTLRENRNSDLLRIVFTDFPRELAEHGLFLALGLGAAWGLQRSLPRFRPVWIMFCLIAVMVSNPVEYLRNSTIGLKDARAIDPARDFRAPEILSRPDKPRNLVLIYLESLERSYRDMPATAAAFAPFARLEDEGFSARHVQQISGTHFTAGGITASQCGVPLFSRGVFDATVIGLGDSDQTGAFASFMPAITCLGDILAADGYTGHYLNGSDAGMFSIGTLLTTHGYKSVVGMATDPRWQDHPERNIWGVNDRVLFEEARRQIAELAGAGRPFFMAVLTTGTHGPDGYPDADCSIRAPNETSQLPQAIACSAEHVTACSAGSRSRASPRPPPLPC